jgi:acyl dehydratase
MSEENLMKIIESFIGQSAGPSRHAAVSINQAMIQHWCDAIGDDNPSYVDAEFADTSTHRGIVAPPTMLQAWTMAGYRGAQETAEKDAEESGKTILDVLDDAGFTSVVATDCEQEYFRLLKLGDQLSHDVKIESVSPEKKTGLGVGHFVTQLYTYRDGHGEIVGQMRFRLLKFRPPNVPDDATN